MIDDNQIIRDMLDLSVKGLNSRMDTVRHIAKFFDMFDRPYFPLFVGYSLPTSWTWVNKPFADFLGYKKEVIYTKPWTDFIVKEQRDSVIDVYNEKLKGDEVYNAEPTPMTGSDGVVHLVEWTTSEIHPLEISNQTICIAPIPKTYKRNK